MSQKSSSSLSVSSTSLSSDKSISQDGTGEKRKRVFDLDLNCPPPQIIENPKFEATGFQVSDDGVLVIGSDRDENCDSCLVLDNCVQESERSLDSEESWVFDEGRSYVTKRRRYTVEEKGKGKVDHDHAYDFGYKPDDRLELRLALAIAITEPDAKWVEGASTSSFMGMDESYLDRHGCEFFSFI